MYKCVKPIFFKAMSGIHAGTGSDLGLVDLPIQRERHSGLPKIESSGVKGCIRDEFEELARLKEIDADFVEIAFGPDDSGDKHAGSTAFTDARLLLFPVRSAKGIFAYATCPYILNRFVDDLKFAKVEFAPGVCAGTKAAQVSGNALTILDKNKIVLEEFTIDAEKTEYAEKAADAIAACLQLGDYQSKLLNNNFVILSDDAFNDFARNNTEIITRIKINNDTGTVETGALFTEELLPAETVLYSLVCTTKILLPRKPSKAADIKEGVLYFEDSETAKKAGADDAKYLIDTITERMPEFIQIGGDATIGKGLCRVTMGVTK